MSTYLIEEITVMGYNYNCIIEVNTVNTVCQPAKQTKIAPVWFSDRGGRACRKRYFDALSEEKRRVELFVRAEDLSAENLISTVPAPPTSAA